MKLILFTSLGFCELLRWYLSYANKLVNIKLKLPTERQKKTPICGGFFHPAWKRQVFAQHSSLSCRSIVTETCGVGERLPAT